MRRVVITGIGVISSIGTGKEDFMEGILSGKDGKRIFHILIQKNTP